MIVGHAKTMTIVYWIAVIIGALAVLWLIRKYASSNTNISSDINETFEGQEPAAPPAAKSALDNNYTETLMLTGFPKQPDTALALYLSSFSDKVAYTNASAGLTLEKEGSPNVYDGEMGAWRDLLVNERGFKIHVVDTAKGVIPPTIKTRNELGLPVDIGLSLQSLQMIGPSSREIGERVGSTTAFALTPFTAAFYGIIENIEFTEGEQRKVLFRITAENPSLVEIAIRKRDNRNVLVEVILGDAGRAYQWVVDKYMLMSNRLPTLYALTYDKGSKSTPVRAPAISLYIGKTKLQKTFTQADAPADIRLGNSEIILNPTGTFNMKLVAFVYFKSVLDDAAMDGLGVYFTQQLSGIDVVISKKQEEYTALTTELQKKLADATRTLDDAEDELKQCKAAADAALKASPHLRKRQWQVSLDETGAAEATSRLNDDDLKKCAPLALVGKLAQVTSPSAAALPSVNDPTKKPTVPITSAPFKKVNGDPTAAPAPSASAKSKSTEPPASLSDPSASIWERLNDVLA